MTTASRYRPYSSLDRRSIGHAFARLDHLFQARFNPRFGPLVRRLATLLPVDAVVADIGANHGRFSRTLAGALRGRVRILAFEPLEYNFQILRAVTPRRSVRCFRVALSDRAGETSLYIPVRPSGRIAHGAGHFGDESADVEFGTSTAKEVVRHDVPTDTLDAVLAREGVERLDLLKIDVQGAERLVLDGARATLDRDRPSLFIELCPGMPEFLGGTVHDAVSPLLGLGYRVWGVDERTMREREVAGFDPEFRDFLFVHPSRLGGDA